MAKCVASAHKLGLQFGTRTIKYEYFKAETYMNKKMWKQKGEELTFNIQ